MRKKPYLWEKSAFDSEALGVSAAKILEIRNETPKQVRANVEALIHELTEANVQYAVYRIPAAEYSTIQCVEKQGFVMVDGVITLNMPVPPIGAFSNEFIGEALPEDYAQLSLLSGSVFRGGSRYYHDAWIPERTADAVYRKWMKNSLEGTVADSVLVWRERGKILGFITLQKKEKRGDIPLIGVSSVARGKGIGKHLIHAAVSMCTKWRMSEVSVATQVTNIPALRLYQSCGFSITASYVTLRWLREK